MQWRRGGGGRGGEWRGDASRVTRQDPQSTNSEGKGKRKRNRGNEPGPLVTSLMTASAAPLTGFGVWLDVRMRKDQTVGMIRIQVVTLDGSSKVMAAVAFSLISF